MKMTFCAYDSPKHIGGPNTVLRRLLPALQGQGCEPGALILRTGGLAEGATASGLKRRQVPVAQTLRPPSTEALLGWLLRRLADEPPDVFAPDYVAPAYFATRWLRPAGIVAVGTIHGNDPFYDALIDEFVLGDPAYRLDGLVCVSRFVEQTVRARIGRRATTTLVRCIPTGVPLAPRVASPPEGRLRLAYLGRLAETHKRASEVARSICRAAREIDGVEGVIYGDGPSRGFVERILQTEGAGLPVRLAGSVDNDLVQDRLLECHALVLLSDSEGLPMAVMEAMACGVVPIVLNVPTGALELVEHEVTGLLVDDRGDSFVAAVRRLRDEPGLWLRLSRAAREKIAAEYSTERAAAGWAAFAQELRLRAGPRQPLRVPQRFDLPPVRPGLAHLDERALPLHRGALRQARRVAGYVRRRIRGG
ncbi:MAG: glycosyltransferase family 4 protein [Kouleothrix sp.]|nr:glycosyltransferase family 4 protein [Kouleothrix sp.]